MQSISHVITGGLSSLVRVSMYVYVCVCVARKLRPLAQSALTIIVLYTVDKDRNSHRPLNRQRRWATESLQNGQRGLVQPQRYELVRSRLVSLAQNSHATRGRRCTQGEKVVPSPMYTYATLGSSRRLPARGGETRTQRPLLFGGRPGRERRVSLSGQRRVT